MCRSIEETNLCALAITSSQASSLGMQEMEEKFNLARRSWEDYKDTQFYNGQQALVVECWLNLVEEDAPGLIFEEWDPTQDAEALQPPVALLINLSELRAASFTVAR